ncbi:MAG: glycosyltransferase family 4 protein [Chloroflexota bacterium]|nr:glycosyltransferase family 4 protein [Chloroflexota bacterium]
MKIVMLGPFGLRPRGTMSVRALPLARALVKRGHVVTMLLPPWQNPEDAGRSWVDAGVRIENLSLPARVPGWFHLRLATALARRACELQPDLVYAFKPKAYAGLAHWLLAHFSTLPVIVDTDDWEGPGGWNDLNPYPRLLKWFFVWQERWGLRRAAAVTVASRALQTLTWAQGVAPERVHYLPNGVIARPAASASAYETSPRPTLLLYTRFFEYKVTRLWRIVVRVKAARPDMRLWVVGKGFFAEEQLLLQLAREAGWRVTEKTPPAPMDDLIYAGLAPAAALPAHFAQADVALYPFDDTLINRTKCPVKLLDLLAAGIPVVAEAVGEIPQMICAEETGILVPPGDDEAFTAALLALLDDEPRCLALGARAAADVRARFSWDQLAARVESVF